MNRENWNSFLEGFEKGVARGVFAAVLIFVFLALSTNAFAEPCRVGAHVATWHVKPGFEAATYGAYVEDCSGLTLGTLRNSEGTPSIYVARTWHSGNRRWSITAGGITGYQSRFINPMLIPSYAQPVGRGWAVRFSLLPPLHKSGSAAVHFSLEKNL